MKIFTFNIGLNAYSELPICSSALQILVNYSINISMSILFNIVLMVLLIAPPIKFVNMLRIVQMTLKQDFIPCIK